LSGITTKIIYNENPLEVAKSFEAQWNRILAFGRFNGQNQAKLSIIKTWNKLIQTKLKIDFGGD
jgi:phosphoribosylformimino-5-aminoimidazole carboxamide ribotide isomerase